MSLLHHNGRVTLAQVAKRAGVALSTASLVLNGKGDSVKISRETARAVHAAAVELGYTPNHFARSLRLKHSGLVGVVFSSISQDVPAELFSGIRETLDHSKTSLEPLLTSHDFDAARERKQLLFLAQNRVEAVIVTPAGPYLENYRPILADGIPVVLVMHGFPEAEGKMSGVFLNSAGMSHMAIQHLVKGGARRIAYLAWDYGTAMSREKLAGIQAAAMVMPSEAALTNVIIQQPETSFEASLDVLFANPRNTPDALLCNPYSVAIECLDYLDARKISVPQDCAVMSLHDHSIFESRRLAITAIRQDNVFMGRRAAEVALQLIETKSPEIIVERHDAFHLVQRATTRSP